MYKWSIRSLKICIFYLLIITKVLDWEYKTCIMGHSVCVAAPLILFETLLIIKLIFLMTLNFDVVWLNNYVVSLYLSVLCPSLDFFSVICI